MLRHLLRITIRNLFKTKLHSIINILGLSLGIACSVLIILFVKDELTFDNFHKKKDDLYRVYYEAERRDGSETVQSVVPIAMGNSLKEDYPAVQMNSFWYSYPGQIFVGEESFEETINMADTSFFKMFDFEVASGSVEKALETPSDIVITREMAQKYFGEDEAVGKYIQIPIGPERRDFEVKAVLENIPSNSSLQFDILVSGLLGKDMFPPQMLTSWHFVAAEHYVLLQPGTNPSDLEPQFYKLVQEVLGEDLGGRKFDIKLQPITDIHLNDEISQGIAPVSDPTYTIVLTAIAILILAMASINFMNLSLGRSLTRAREIGVKKAVGAVRTQLVIQFLMEALVLSFVALAAGIAVAYLALPMFNELSGKELVFQLDLSNLSIFIGLSVLVAFMAGFYPALVMSGFKPVNILKGDHGVGGGRQSLRMFMITFQLVLSIFLITSALFMKEQMGYIVNKNLGFDKEQVLVVPMTAPNARGLEDALVEGMEKAERGRPVIAALPSVENVGISSHTFENGSWTEISWYDENSAEHSFFYNKVDANYIEVLDMEIVSGRGFLPDNESDKRRSIIVNEAFVKEFGFDNAVGERIPGEEFEDHEIIGVVKDFNFSSLHNEIEPLVLAINHMIPYSGSQNVSLNSSYVPKLMVRLRQGELSQGIEQIQEKWEELYPGEPYNYSFLDESIQEQYEREANLNTIITYATILSVLIGALGLFGLATLTMTARLKEMSIRKILGAGQTQLIFLLSRSYLLLVILATILSAPLTYFFIQNWLTNFAFKIEIGLGPFLLGTLIILTISFLSLAYQSLKIVFSNPVDTLRSE